MGSGIINDEDDNKDRAPAERCGWVQGSRPDSIEESPCKRTWCMLNPSGPNALPLVWRGIWGGAYRHLNTVQIYEGSNWCCKMGRKYITKLN
ncbi:hypothetical protein AVEN_189195-1 [Araneus ventricosus]|uniref:Uncharacterized protein n=1 Tax=Araneus ventricosus TaxID=182803 RepID=A0A4Y2KGT3_ARAVE|nr:hypothetical protein AVEN_189195-1 [Araneus ventricosus]